MRRTSCWPILVALVALLPPYASARTPCENALDKGKLSKPWSNFVDCDTEYRQDPYACIENPVVAMGCQQRCGLCQASGTPSPKVTRGPTTTQQIPCSSAVVSVNNTAPSCVNALSAQNKPWPDFISCDDEYRQDKTGCVLDAILANGCQKTCGFCKTARRSGMGGEYRAAVNAAGKPQTLNDDPVFVHTNASAAVIYYMYFHVPNIQWVLGTSLPRDDGKNPNLGILAASSGSCHSPWDSSCTWKGGRVTNVSKKAPSGSGTSCADGACWSSPCLNGGTCSAANGSFSCHCKNGNRGARCELETWCESGGNFSNRPGLNHFDGSWCDCVSTLSWFGINKNNSASLRKRIGDSVCDSTFNIPQCNFDGGDCVSNTSGCRAGLRALLKHECCRGQAGSEAGSEIAYCDDWSTASGVVRVPRSCTVRCGSALAPFYANCSWDQGMDLPSYALDGLQDHCTSTLLRAGPRCSDGETLVSLLQKCDANCDCPGSCDDEVDCSYTRSSLNCSAGSCMCINNRSIPQRWRCDGKQDCGLGEDEHSCASYLGLTQPWTKPLTVLSTRGGLSCAQRMQSAVLAQCGGGFLVSCASAACRAAYIGWYLDCSWSLSYDNATRDEAASYFVCCTGKTATGCKSSAAQSGAALATVQPCPRVHGRPSPAAVRVRRIGDGWCDEALDCDAYAADGGDCDPGVSLSLPYEISGPFSASLFHKALAEGVPFIDDEDVSVVRFSQNVSGAVRLLDKRLTSRFFYKLAPTGRAARAQFSGALARLLSVDAHSVQLQSVSDIAAPTPSPTAAAGRRSQRRQLALQKKLTGTNSRNDIIELYGNADSNLSSISASGARPLGVSVGYALTVDKDVSAPFQQAARNRSLSDLLRTTPPSIIGDVAHISAQNVDIRDPVVSTRLTISVALGRSEYEQATGTRVAGGNAAAAARIEAVLTKRLLNTTAIVNAYTRLSGSASSFTLRAQASQLSVRRRREHDDHEPEDDGVEEELAAAVLLLLALLLLALVGLVLVLVCRKAKTRVLVVDKSGNVIATFESEVDEMERGMLMKMLQDKMATEQSAVEEQQLQERVTQQRRLAVMQKLFASKRASETSSDEEDGDEDLAGEDGGAPRTRTQGKHGPAAGKPSAAGALLGEYDKDMDVLLAVRAAKRREARALLEKKREASRAAREQELLAQPDADVPQVHALMEQRKEAEEAATRDAEELERELDQEELSAVAAAKQQLLTGMRDGTDAEVAALQASASGDMQKLHADLAATRSSAGRDCPYSCTTPIFIRAG